MNRALSASAGFFKLKKHAPHHKNPALALRALIRTSAAVLGLNPLTTYTQRMGRLCFSAFLGAAVVALILGGTETASGQTLMGAALPLAEDRPARLARSLNAAVSKTSSRRSLISHKQRTIGKNSDMSLLPEEVRQVVALQAALDRAGFSPGIIDGLMGPKTTRGLRTFQEANGLPITGQLDAATRSALAMDQTPFTRRYSLTEEDRSQVGPCPSDWISKSKTEWLGFQSLASVAAFRGHCSRRLLARLNPDRTLTSLRPRDEIIIPNVLLTESPAGADAIQIDFGTKTIRIYAPSGNPISLFHCSIANEKWQRPDGPCRVAGITLNPNYLFKPESWPEVRGVDQPLVIPPGPRNPVGLCWIGLSIKGYGIHGTPQPELIGKTGSHGCFRLTNWDALRLAKIVRVGAKVDFIDSSADGPHGD